MLLVNKNTAWAIGVKQYITNYIHSTNLLSLSVHYLSAGRFRRNDNKHLHLGLRFR